jgi:sigma-B regulation protein RsbU (phosphoserine phosphatase)
MRRGILEHSGHLGAAAVKDSQEALEDQARKQIVTLAQEKAAYTDDKLLFIQNQTRAVAEMATQVYTHKDRYKPRPIDYLRPGQTGTSIPHIRTAKGVSFSSIRDELYLAANVTDVQRQITISDTGIAASYLGGEAGFLITVDETERSPNRTDYDVKNRPWYTGAKEKDGLFWTDIFADSLGRGPGVSCAMPFYDLSGGKRVFKGVAASVSILANIVEKVIKTAKISETGYAFLLNEKGQVTLSSRGTGDITDASGNIIGEDYLHSGNPQLRELARRMTNRENGLMELELEGRAVYIAYYPLSVVNWSLGVVGSIDEIIAPALRIQEEITEHTRNDMAAIDSSVFRVILYAVAVNILTALVTVFVAIRFSNSLTAPIISLNEDAKTISSGDLDHKLMIATGDEIGQMAESFNLMIDNIKQITGEKERIAAELGVATKIQASMLPCIFPAFPERNEFDIYAEMHPAKEVGGDFYDFFLVDPNTLAVVIADVSGKGVPAALFMVIAKTLIKNHAQMGKPLEEIFQTVNNQLCENNDTSMFVTAFMGLYDITTGRFRYVNAGHNPPVIRQNFQEFTWLKTKPGLILAAMENTKFKVMETVLEPNDILFLYTDGVNEAMNPREEQFSSERILTVLNAAANKNYNIREYTNCILDEVKAFANGAEQADDITMLMLQRRNIYIPNSN